MFGGCQEIQAATDLIPPAIQHLYFRFHAPEQANGFKVEKHHRSTHILDVVWAHAQAVLA
jgi:hypothetical protein